MSATTATKRTQVRDDAQLWRQMKWVSLRCIDTEDSVILHKLAAGGGWVYVIGHPDFGSYEFVVLEHGPFAQDPPEIARVLFSDCGYGGSDVALRDGLIVACGGHAETDPAFAYVREVTPCHA